MVDKCLEAASASTGVASGGETGAVAGAETGTIAGAEGGSTYAKESGYKSDYVPPAASPSMAAGVGASAAGGYDKSDDGPISAGGAGSGGYDGGATPPRSPEVMKSPAMGANRTPVLVMLLARALPALIKFQVAHLVGARREGSTRRYPPVHQVYGRRAR